MFQPFVTQLCNEGRLPHLSEAHCQVLVHEALLPTLEMLDADEPQRKISQGAGRNPRKRQKLSPPEGPTSVSDMANLAVATPTPAPVQMATPVDDQGQIQRNTIDGNHVPTTQMPPPSLNLEEQHTTERLQKYINQQHQYNDQLQQEQHQEQQTEQGGISYNTGDLPSTPNFNTELDFNNYSIDPSILSPTANHQYEFLP